MKFDEVKTEDPLELQPDFKTFKGEHKLSLAIMLVTIP